MTNSYGAYTPVRKAGDFLFVSGQVGIDPETRSAAPDIQSQVKQALVNLERTLASCDATLDSVIKTTVFLTSMDDYAAMNDAYEQAFSTPRPARSAVGVQELPRVASNTRLLVEIEAIALKTAS